MDLDRITALTLCYGAIGARHLRPPVEAVRDCGVEVLIVPQHVGELKPPRDSGPLIAPIGDDADAAFGPDASHGKSLRRPFHAAHGSIVVSSGPELGACVGAATLPAVGQRNAVLVETRSEQNIEFIQATAPCLPLMLRTVKGGTA